MEEEDFPRGPASPSDGIPQTPNVSSPPRKRRKKTIAPKVFESDKTFRRAEITSGSFQVEVLGGKVLGMVTEVTSTHVRVSLPHGVEATVEASDSSDIIAEMMNADSSEGKTLREVNGSIPDLTEIFIPGQYIHGTFIQQDESPDVKLSLKLKDFYSEVMLSKSAEGVNIAGCIRSVEDHGYTLSFGIKGVSGFLHKKDVCPFFEEGFQLLPGQLVNAVVKAAGSRGVLHLTMNPDIVKSALMIDKVKTTARDILPGDLVYVKVTEVFENGLHCSFGESHKGVISLLHLSGLKEDYVSGQVVKSRVLSRDPSTSLYNLSLLDFLVEQNLPRMPAIIGQVFTSAMIQRIDSKGLLLDLPTQPVSTKAYIHQSSLSDLPTVQCRDYYLHQAVHVRITGFQALDGLVVGSMKESVIRSGIVCFDDVSPGLVAEGTIFRVYPDRVLVSISEGIVGFGRFSASLPLKKLFKEGQVVKYRVLKLKPALKQVVVSLDSMLVNSKVPFLTHWEDAKVGMQVIGYVLAVKNRSIIIAFAGDLCGILPEANMNLSPEDSMSSCFPKNKTVKVWIKSINPVNQKVILTLKKGDYDILKKAEIKSKRLEMLREQCKCPQGVEVGEIASAVLIKKLKDESGFLIKLNFLERDLAAKGVLLNYHLADHPLVHQHLDDLEDGTDLGEVVLLKTKDYIEVSRKPCLVENASMLPRKLEEVTGNMLLPGFVSFVGKEFVDVNFLNGLKGRVFSNQTPLTRIPVFQQFQLGQSVQVRVVKVDHDRQRINLSMSSSRLSPADSTFLHHALLDPILFPSHLTFSQRKIGSLVSIRKIGVDDDGVKCEIADHKNLAAYIPRQHCTDSNGKEIAVEDLDEVELRAYVLDVTAERKVVLSLKPYLCQKGFQTIRKRKKEKKTLIEKSKHEAHVEFVCSHYLIVSLPEDDHTIAKVPLSDYNLQFRSLFRAFKDKQHIEVERQLSTKMESVGCPILSTPLLPLVWKANPKTSTNIIPSRNNVFLTKDDKEILSTGRSFQKGDLVSGVVVKIKDGGLLALLTGDPHGSTALIPFIDLFDFFTDNLSSVVHPGQAFRGLITKQPPERLHLSVRESDGGMLEGSLEVVGNCKCPVRLTREKINRGDELFGYVSHFSKKMDCLFVSLARDLFGTIHAPHFGDEPLSSSLSDYFSVGQLVKGTIVSLNYPKVGLSLRSGEKPIAEIGKIKNGVVMSVLPQGTYVKLDESGIQGLVPKVEMQAHQKKAYKVGDSVKVLVDHSTDGFFLNLKFMESQEEAKEELMDISEDEDDSVASQDFEEAMVAAVQDDNNQFPSEIQEDHQNIIQPRQGDPFIWNESEEEQEEKIKGQQDHKTAVVKRKKMEAKPSMKSLEDPESLEDFERLLLSDSNSSYFWIKYMVFFLEKGNIAKARSTAERALECMSFREEKGKLDVWLAYLNLEKTQGSSVETMMSLFQRAVLSNDPKKLHLTFVKVLEESQETELGDLVVKSMRRRCPTSAKVYIQEIHYWLQTKRGGKCKETLDRALKSLPKRKHVKVLRQAALLEFKLGMVERGRDIFEGLVSCYPKRMDLWNVYLDQELHLKDKEHARALLERACAVDAGRKRMKGMFKRYLQFESEHGNHNTIESVKQKAKDYITRKNKEMENPPSTSS